MPKLQFIEEKLETWNKAIFGDNKERMLLPW